MLAEGIAALSLSLPAGAEEKLLAFVRLLAKWNRTYNLTAVRDEQEMVAVHLLDSLAVLPFLGELRTLADVGSGAGLPGIVLAITCPDLRVTSIEANQKKAAFQRQATIELGVGNVQVLCGRVEDATGQFDGAISRAFSDVADFIRLAGHLAPRLYAMKGVYPEEELEHLPAGWRLVESRKLTVPGLDAERHVIVLGRN
jgi:16S rRNA (guanine527-N7)-methyltransferase